MKCMFADPQHVFFFSGNVEQRELMMNTVCYSLNKLWGELFAFPTLVPYWKSTEDKINKKKYVSVQQKACIRVNTIIDRLVSKMVTLQL